MFQSTPPRGERRDGDGELITLFNVSIHAPARGATAVAVMPLSNCTVSIHAPARGATLTGMEVI